MSEIDRPIHGPELPDTVTNTHRAQREMERWLYSGGDEREMSERMSGRGLPNNWRENATHVMTIVYEEGNLEETSYIRPENIQDSNIPEVSEGE